MDYLPNVAIPGIWHMLTPPVFLFTNQVLLLCGPVLSNGTPLLNKKIKEDLTSSKQFTFFYSNKQNKKKIKLGQTTCDLRGEMENLKGRCVSMSKLNFRPWGCLDSIDSFPEIFQRNNKASNSLENHNHLKLKRFTFFPQVFQPISEGTFE